MGEVDTSSTRTKFVAIYTKWYQYTVFNSSIILQVWHFCPLYIINETIDVDHLYIVDIDISLLHRALLFSTLSRNQVFLLVKIVTKIN